MIDNLIGTSWHSYADSKALGHKMIAELFFDPVVVEEKVDGSQFSFGIIGDQLKFRSKGAEIFVTPDGHSSEKMFEKAVQAVMSRQFQLREGYTYRAEYVPKPKAVTLTYDRTPKDFLIGFDIARGEENYLSPAEKREEFARIGLEVVPCFFEGRIEDIEILRDMLKNISVLGGQQIEGVVVKNYARFGADKKILIGKYVSKDFQELHHKTWAKDNPKSGDIVQQIIEMVRTPARWRKGVQHLREAGTLTETPRDIPLLFKEVKADIEKECTDLIKDMLFNWAWDQIARGATAGIAEWYKEELAKEQPFSPDGNVWVEQQDRRHHG